MMLSHHGWYSDEDTTKWVCRYCDLEESLVWGKISDDWGGTCSERTFYELWLDDKLGDE